MEEMNIIAEKKLISRVGEQQKKPMAVNGSNIQQHREAMQYNSSQRQVEYLPRGT